MAWRSLQAQTIIASSSSFKTEALPMEEGQPLAGLWFCSNKAQNKRSKQRQRETN
jgi:hypothetical protein